MLTCTILGPVEFTDEVLASMSHPSMSHVGAPFVNVFGESLELFRKVLNADMDTQPFIVAGSGTLGWDMVASNLCEKGDDALVLHTGYGSWDSVSPISNGCSLLLDISAIRLLSALKYMAQM